ncbi:MAG: DUF2807 domain-containing protein [Chitinispirillaceae bacterium]|nr:DUF2807 domain-containing protein [Chitinispirillaceae bacterium]
MKTPALLFGPIAVILVAATGCVNPFQTYYCSDDTVTYASTPITTFSTVEFAQQCEATITQSDSFWLSVEINENISEHLDIDKNGSRVRFSLRNNYTYQNLTFKVAIGMPVLDGVDASGASKVTVSGFSSERNFVAELSGASSLQGDIACDNARFNLSGASKGSISLECNALGIDLSGASILECNGSAGNITCDVSGASNLKLKKLPCNNVSVDISGASHMYTSPAGTISGDVSGASMLYYYGSPNMGSIDVSGASAVRKAD